MVFLGHGGGVVKRPALVVRFNGEIDTVDVPPALHYRHDRRSDRGTPARSGPPLSDAVTVTAVSRGVGLVVASKPV